MSGLRALLSGAIDYAGTFPPASLSLEQAAQNYCNYRRQAEAWMLGGMVCRAGDFDRFASLVKHEPAAEAEAQFRVCALLDGGDTGQPFLEAARLDASRIAASPLGRCISTLEVRAPAEAIARPDFSCLAPWSGALLAGNRSPCLYLELPPAGIRQAADWPGLIHTLAEQCRGLNCGQSPTIGSVGVKLRLGGVTAEAAPSVALLAQAICSLRDEGLPWKATAGLHQPLAHADPARAAQAHGFVNLFVAAVMADVHRLPPAEIEAILDDENPANFAFDDASVRWRSIAASAVEVASSRRCGLRSFGSCSFDEPREGLRSLGWLP